MARPLRIEFAGAIYHLSARGNDRQSIYRSEADRRRFLSLLERSSRRYRVSVLVFVLMPNHFHLVAQTQQANLSRWMHWLMVSYTVFFNWRHGRSGHLFQGRYKSFLVEAGEYLLELSRYLHLNPVRGKVLGRGNPAERRERLRSFRWSSYRGYAGLEKPFPFVEEEMVLGEFGGTRPRYRRFVEEGLVREVENPLDVVRWQTVLGSESFAQKIQDRMRGVKKSQREVTALRRGARREDPFEMVKQVAQHYGLAAANLRERGGYGLEARNVAMWLIWEKCGMSLREIGEFFGGMEYSAVAQRLRRLKPESRQKAHRLANANKRSWSPKHSKFNPRLVGRDSAEPARRVSGSTESRPTK